METVLAGRYHLIHPLGSGGFGQTFLATDRHLPGHPVCVVKQLQPKSDTRELLEVAKRLFDLEAETLYRLKHDQIPRLLAHFAQDGEFYLVQEFIEGESLQQEFTHCLPYPEAAAVALLHDILEVLAFVHQQGVIHRDIKPSNLMRRHRGGKVMLIDFGAVKQISLHPTSTGESSLTVAIGSPGYIPPEQLASQPQFSSDIYAVGIVVLQALTGILPTQLPKDEKTGEICCARLGTSLLIHPELAVILDTMVRYDYRHRYANAAEALHALKSVEAFLSSDATPTQLQPIASSSASASDTYRQPNQAETRPPKLSSLIQIFEPPARQAPSPNGTGATPTLTSQEYRNRQALLNKVKNFWVKGVLETSLYDQILIVLGLETRPDAVPSPWNVALAVEDQRMRFLPQGTQVSSIFDQMGTGRSLLILGEPGSGKTTTLLQLARDLIAHAERDANHLIPVVLNLSSWTNPSQPIATWIVDELNTKYQGPKPIGQTWVRQQQLLLLLDGLDEVREEARDACVVALNAFQQEYSSELVVCSRIRDYEQLSQRLNVQTAVYLRSLTAEQVQVYLDSLGADLAGLKQLLQEDESLRELAQSPLLLNIMVLAYQGMSLDELPKANRLVERRKQVFDAYIDRMFQRQGRRQSYSKAQSLHWLSWLAQQMVRHSQAIFLIERLDRHWLQTDSQRWRYTLISTSMIGLLMGLIFGLAMGLGFGLVRGIIAGLIAWLTNSLLQAAVVWFVLVVERLPTSPTQHRRQQWVYSIGAGISIGTVFGLLAGLLQGVMAGILAGLIGGLISGLIDRLTGGKFTQSTLDPTERLQWSWKNIKAKLIFWLPVGSITGIIFHLIGATNSTLPIALFSGWFVALTAGVLTGLSSSSEIETKTVPNQGIWQSAQNFLLVGLIGSLMLSLGSLWLSMPIYFAIIFGLLISLSVGGSACVVHLSLRLLFWRDRNMPWNYARFLNDAAQLTFLQKVGGGYIFIHRLLMEHFAQKGGV